MKRLISFPLMTLLLLTLALTAAAQGGMRFSVVSFAQDQFDLTASTDPHKRMDGSGSLYALIKVSSTDGDNLQAYNFNFGNMNHIVEPHDGELWVYVQRNAKTVTISRAGYATINRHDLQHTLEAGRTYRMQLSPQAAKVYLQMVQFLVEPAASQAFVSITPAQAGAAKEGLGVVDSEGSIARNLPYGTYNYEVVASNYYTSEGTFTLDNENQTHQEKVILRPRFSLVTLSVAADADIYVNNELKGRRSWQGPLNAGTYQVECRQTNHRPTQQTITVQENKPLTLTLQAPTPITGRISVISRPSGATITIDGKDYGSTPRNINDLLIGSHQLTLKKSGYRDASQSVSIKEGDMTEVNATLTAAASSTPPQGNLVQGGSSTGGDRQTFTVGGVSFQMVRVEGKGSPFYIGETEVTQALWQAVMGSNPSYFKGTNRPVEQVSWDDCKTFISKLNSMTGRNFRLPKEAEWEYAAKGGNKSRGYEYSGCNSESELEQYAWYDKNAYYCGSSSANSSHPDYGTHNVKTKRPNELGIYDMSGNVWEWCEDLYDSSGSYRVFRGGSWNFNARNCRVAIRNWYSPVWRYFNLGLRLAL